MKKNIPEHFTKDPHDKAIDALNYAHLLAWGPHVWEVTSLIVDRGILKLVGDHNGIEMKEVEKAMDMSHYGIRVILEAGLGIGLVYRKEGKYYITKAGYFLLHNQSVYRNYRFMKDVCYQGARFLEKCIVDGKPYGLKTLGPWETIYQGLSTLPQPAKDSWFNFDHYYSDTSFDEILPEVFKSKPKSILDIGGNTGKWALVCMEYNPEVKMGIVDLAGQLELAKENVENQGFGDRTSYYERNMLDPKTKLPEGYDILWMSQFLDCFSDEEIVSILEKCYCTANEDTVVYINETFWDLQRFEKSAFVIQMTSLYFTTMANGNSQMYDSKTFFELIDKAGFEIIEKKLYIGIGGHTLLMLKKKKNASN